MKIVAFSDSHWRLDKLEIPSGDVLVFAGDWSQSNGSIMDAIKFAAVIKKVDCKHKLIIAGNHDFCAQNETAVVAQIFQEAGAVYLQDKTYTIDNINFYGTPWCPEFMNWAFMKPDYELTHVFSKIPSNTDVLITHTPPYGIMDMVDTRENVGSHALEESMKRIKPAIHIFGHIHDGHGVEHSDTVEYYNVSVCDDTYNLVHKPTIIEV